MAEEGAEIAPPSTVDPQSAPATQWSATDDAVVVWLMLCSPFSEFKRVVASLHELQNKRLESIIPRFLEIMDNPELVQRVNAECKGDIIGYRSATWTRHEQLSLLRLVRNNKKCSQQAFLTKFPTLFHPARSSATLNATYARLRGKEGSFDNQLAQFESYCKAIHTEVEGKELLPFPGGFADPVAEVESVLAAERLDADVPTIEKDETFDAIRKRTADLMTQRTLACLVGEGNIRAIRKPKVMIGRSSPRCKPDIDLADLHLQSVSRNHCELFLAKDLKFYLTCHGNMVIVNGTIYKRGQTIRINEKDLIDIGGCVFVFMENLSLMQSLRQALN